MSTPGSSSFHDYAMGVSPFDPFTSMDPLHPDPFDPFTSMDPLHPDSFDRDIDCWELESDRSFQPPTHLDDTFSIPRGPPPVSASPSVFTYSTESSSDTAPSEYSDTGPPSEHSMSLGLNFQSIGVSSAYREVNTMDGSIFLSPSPDGLTSFGSLPPSPSTSPPIRTLSLSNQQIAIPSFPAVLPVQAAPDTQLRSRPTKKHQCHICGHSKTDS